MFSQPVDRRRFLYQAASGLGALTGGLSLGCDERHLASGALDQPRQAPNENAIIERRPYKGPNVVLIRFGGGVRRLETIQSAEKTHCPFVYHELFKKQGILYNN